MEMSFMLGGRGGFEVQGNEKQGARTMACASVCVTVHSRECMRSSVCVSRVHSSGACDDWNRDYPVAAKGIEGGK